MSVKHVCPNCGSTLTLDAPMPSLRCPRCKTAMQPETSAAAVQQPAAEAPVRTLRVARTVTSIGVQPSENNVSVDSFLEKARLQIKQEREQMMADALKQIQQEKDDAQKQIQQEKDDAQKQIQQEMTKAEASLQQLKEQKTAEANTEAENILEAARQNARQIENEAEAAAQKIIEESHSQQPVAPVDSKSFEEKKAEIDKIAHQNHLRFWQLNALVLLIILTLACALKANGNTLVAVLSWFATLVSLALASWMTYDLRVCLAQLKAEKNTPESQRPAVHKEEPRIQAPKIKTMTVSSVKSEKASQEEAEQTQPTVRKTLLPVTKKKTSKPILFKKKTSE